MKRRPVIIGLFMSFLIAMAAVPVGAAVDFSGEWEGEIYSITYDMRVDFFLSLTQDGTDVTGTLTIVGAICGAIEDFPLTGRVNGEILSFQAIGHCRGDVLIKASQCVLSDNKLTGVYTSYEDGEWHGESEFYLWRPTHTISATAGSGGTISPHGETSVNAGTNRTFSILPDSGYEILDVVVDGVPLGAISSYTFSEVVADHTISATFQLPQKRATASGIVRYNGETLCAMVLANGQYVFTCQAGDDFGKYELDVPLDANEEITIQAFVSGMAPFRQTTDESDLDIDIDMQTADPQSKSPDVTTVNRSDASTPANRARITGTVTFGGTSLCAMVLANGQYMFSCGANDGVYDLTVPLDGDGHITLYVFVSGKRPYKQTFTP